MAKRKAATKSKPTTARKAASKTIPKTAPKTKPKKETGARKMQKKATALRKKSAKFTPVPSPTRKRNLRADKSKRTLESGFVLLRHTKQQVIDAVRASLGIATNAAARLGTTRTSLNEWRANDSDIDNAFFEGREKFVDIAEDQLKKNVASGDAPSVFFALKCLGKQRGYVEKSIIAHEGKHKITIDGDESDDDEDT